MAVTVVEGDLFASGAQTLVNTVNCVGVMGKGVALQFRGRFPEMYADYVERCQRREVSLGRPYVFRYPNPPWVLNFPTKDHWRSVARIEDIVCGLDYLLAHYRAWGITSLAVPPLGCGQGQLEWEVVGPTLHQYLGRLDIPVKLYAPFGTPAEEQTLAFMRHSADSGRNEQTGLRPSWVALVEILYRLEQQPYHWPTGRIIFQKLAYVATEAGLPTGLEFVRASFGPFSSGLKMVISKLMNNGLIREQPLGRLIAIRTGRTFAAARQAHADALAQWEPIIDRTVDLFLRLDTRQAETVATVIFAARHLVAPGDPPTELDVYDAVMRWKAGRLPDEDVALAVRSLAARGWIRVRASAELPLPSSESLLV